MTEASDNLRSNQEQCDHDGIMVKVSRQAVDETLEQYDAMAAKIERLEAERAEMLAALKAAVECGMVPVSSAADGGASKYSRMVEVADMIRAAIAKVTGQ